MFLYCLLILICAIVIYFKFLIKSEVVKWELVGEITMIFIYPLDGGPALKLRRALCTKNGLRYDGMVDRTIIAYSKTTKKALLHIEMYENRYEFFRKLKTATANINQQMEKSVDRTGVIKIDYLGFPIKVVPFPTSSAIAAILGNLKNEVQLCYFITRKRRQFMKIIRNKLKKIHDITTKGFLSNYSNYTIVDAENFQELRNSLATTAVTQISFNPQLVVTGRIPTNATCLRIGGKSSKIEFKNITPCTIALPSLNNWVQYSSLFGFNMELKNQTLQIQDGKEKAMIHLGDEVYIKTNNSNVD